MGFDVLALDGKDLERLPRRERKRQLASIMPQVESRVRTVEGIETRGVVFFEAACAHDLEGVVAKWKNGT